MDLSGVELVLAAGVMVLLLLALAQRHTVARLKERVERLEQGGHLQPRFGVHPQAQPSGHLQSHSGVYPAATTPGFSGLPADVEHEVRRLVDSGKKIVAIKLVRERTGLGLKDAKDLVERM